MGLKAGWQKNYGGILKSFEFEYLQVFAKFNIGAICILAGFSQLKHNFKVSYVVQNTQKDFYVNPYY